MNKFLLWNTNKLPDVTDSQYPNNIMHLYAEEMRTGGRVSSTITVDPAELSNFLDAVYNETDAILQSASIGRATIVTFLPHALPNTQGSVVTGFETKVIVFLDHAKAMQACRVWEDYYNLTTQVTQVDAVL